MTTAISRERDVPARWIAVAAAIAAATLYVLIGLGVLPIGKPADGSPGDLVGFGATLGGTFAVVALLISRVHSRVVLGAIAFLQVVVIVGYFAFSFLREPPIEPWGLAIKVCQAVVLAGVAYLLVSRNGHVRE